MSLEEIIVFWVKLVNKLSELNRERCYSTLSSAHLIWGRVLFSLTPFSPLCLLLPSLLLTLSSLLLTLSPSSPSLLSLHLSPVYLSSSPSSASLLSFQQRFPSSHPENQHEMALTLVDQRVRAGGWGVGGAGRPRFLTTSLFYGASSYQGARTL